jgi:hypothetical protein
MCEPGLNWYGEWTQALTLMVPDSFWYYSSEKREPSAIQHWDGYGGLQGWNTSRLSL